MGRTSGIKPPAEPLADEVVLIRLRRAEDLDAIAAASHDPETVRWLQDRPAGEVTAEARRAGLDRVATLWASGKSAPMVIADAATDAAIGLINLQFEDDEVAKLAYSVFPEQRGRGIAPRAVRLVMGWALGELGLNRLLLEADEGNAASIRVAEKCAFQRIGTRLEDDGEHTTVVFVRTSD